jgi:hypothetical protein
VHGRRRPWSGLSFRFIHGKLFLRQRRLAGWFLLLLLEGRRGRFKPGCGGGLGSHRRRRTIRGSPVFLGGPASEKAPELFGDILIDRAGMRLLLCNAEFGQLLKDQMRLDLQVPSQLINSNLLHR